MDFLQRCLAWEPEKRFTPEQAMSHRWILDGPAPSSKRRKNHGYDRGLSHKSGKGRSDRKYSKDSSHYGGGIFLPKIAM